MFITQTPGLGRGAIRTGSTKPLYSTYRSVFYKISTLPRRLVLDCCAFKIDLTHPETIEALGDTRNSPQMHL